LTFLGSQKATNRPSPTDISILFHLNGIGSPAVSSDTRSDQTVGVLRAQHTDHVTGILCYWYRSGLCPNPNAKGGLLCM